MSSLGFIECIPVGFLDTTFPHDMQMVVEPWGELACIAVEFHIAGASEEQVLADRFLAADQLELATFCPFGGSWVRSDPPSVPATPATAVITAPRSTEPP
ncbi:hypothetical protein ABZ876_11935 [Streptomyces sp. NPDC046931]|uniref:hypothetical protein n=1 Tax=Streptomyces sp. NPDC046931 TaxID=3154806 RepID=UPI0033EBC180